MKVKDQGKEKRETGGGGEQVCSQIGDVDLLFSLLLLILLPLQLLLNFLAIDDDDLLLLLQWKQNYTTNLTPGK